MSKSRNRDRMLAHWEEALPELIRFCTRDLEFLQTVEKLDNLPPDNDVESFDLLARAWQLDQAGIDHTLELETFVNDVRSAQEFTKGPYYEEYKARFERYIVNAD